MFNASKLSNYFHLTGYKFLRLAADSLNFFYIRMYLIIIIGLNSLNWIVAYIININVSQELVILHYNIDFGINLIGNVKQIYIIPLLGTIIILINFILLIFIFNLKHQIAAAGKFFAHILLAAALLSNLYLLAGLGIIYLINFLI